MMNRNIEISKSFDRQASRYEAAAKVQQEIGRRLFERLDYLKIKPRYVLDLGCGTGNFIPQLQKKYPKAQIIGLDLAASMLTEAQKKQSFWRKTLLICSDMQSLPFADGAFDLIFSNQVVHWANSLPQLMSEINRVMNHEACLMFSTLGPDTFKELNAAWASADNHRHTNGFPDMHDVGDCLLAECFLDPVVDMEGLTVHYDELKSLVQALKHQGVRNIHPQRNPGLTGKKAWLDFSRAFEELLTEDKKFPLSYEVIYGHAFKGLQRCQNGMKETFIPISHIRAHTVKE